MRDESKLEGESPTDARSMVQPKVIRIPNTENKKVVSGVHERTNETNLVTTPLIHRFLSKSLTETASEFGILRKKRL